MDLKTPPPLPKTPQEASNQDQSTWKPWGDHPLVVAIVVLTAIVSTIVGLASLNPGVPARSVARATPSATPAPDPEWLVPTVDFQNGDQIQLFDGTVYIGRGYNGIYLGGVNLGDVTVAGRTVSGDRLPFEWNTKELRLTTKLREGVVIELGFRKRLFRLDVTSVTQTEGVALKVREIAVPTMSLEFMDTHKKTSAAPATQ